MPPARRSTTTASRWLSALSPDGAGDAERHCGPCGRYFDPTGSITFTLSGPGGFSYTQTDTVSGNGTYTASDTLPTTAR